MTVALELYHFHLPAHLWREAPTRCATVPGTHISALGTSNHARCTRRAWPQPSPSLPAVRRGCLKARPFCSRQTEREAETRAMRSASLLTRGCCCSRSAWSGAMNVLHRWVCGVVVIRVQQGGWPAVAAQRARKTDRSAGGCSLDRWRVPGIRSAGRPRRACHLGRAASGVAGTRKQADSKSRLKP